MPSRRESRLSLPARLRHSFCPCGLSWVMLRVFMSRKCRSHPCGFWTTPSILDRLSKLEVHYLALYFPDTLEELARNIRENHFPRSNLMSDRQPVTDDEISGRQRMHDMRRMSAEVSSANCRTTLVCYCTTPWIFVRGISHRPRVLHADEYQWRAAMLREWH